MTPATVEIDEKILALAREVEDRAGRSLDWLESARRDARETFLERGFPTRRDEDWKYTNVGPLSRRTFSEGSRSEMVPSEFGLSAAHRVTFVNGRLVPELSDVDGLPDGVVLTALERALEDRPEEVRAHLGSLSGEADDALERLNTAVFADGAFLSVPDGVELTRPVELRHVVDAPEGPTASHPRTLVVLGRHAKALVVEIFEGRGETFTNSVGEMIVGEGARLDHVRVENDAEGAWNLACVAFRQERASMVSTRHVALGRGSARTDLRVVLAGEGAHCDMTGVTLGEDSRHVDFHTTIDHAVPNCTSNELFKNVLDGKSTGVFRGRIIVRQDAQKTNAIQTNRNLLLSEGARIYARPQLEIYADDVRCTHGATTGRLDPEALFYLRSRGIDEARARGLLTLAFAGEVLEEIPEEGLRRNLLERLIARLPGGEGLEDPR